MDNRRKHALKILWLLILSIVFIIVQALITEEEEHIETSEHREPVVHIATR